MMWRIRRLGDGLAVLQRRAEVGDAGMARPLTPKEALAAGDDSLVCCRACGDTGPQGHGYTAQAHDVCALYGDSLAP